MERSDKTARQIFAELRADPNRRPFGFGRKPMLVNVDWQNAYTAVGEFASAYDNDPHDALSRGYRTIVPEACVADLHESPHFANLYDMHKKYADVLPVAEVLEYCRSWSPSPP
jgi:hypothetical protein